MKLPQNKFLRWTIVLAAGAATSGLAFWGVRLGTSDYRNEVKEVTKVFQPALDNLADMRKNSIGPDTGFGHAVTNASIGTSDWNGTMGGIVGVLSKPAKEIYSWPKLTMGQIGEVEYYIDTQIKENARRAFPKQAGVNNNWVPITFGPAILTSAILASILVPRKIRSF